jgi:hypothetical protein
MIIPPRNERAVAIDPHRHGTPPTFLILYADANLLLCRHRRNCEAKSGQINSQNPPLLQQSAI